MNIQIVLTPDSSLMVGGKTVNNNFKESLRYIPGSVLRAAFARAIVERCPLGDEPVGNKRYWVQIRKQDECSRCKFYALCRDFSDIRFPTLYPLGSTPYPMTSQCCKYPDSNCQEVVDFLCARLGEHTIPSCGSCGSGRERMDGFHLNGKKVVPRTLLVTKTAVNSQLRTAKYGLLYSINTVTKHVWHDKKLQEIEFSGMITSLDKDVYKVLESISNLRIGSSVTRGLGSCRVSYGVENPDNNSEVMSLESRVQRFNEHIIRQDSEEDGEPPTYITLDVLSDAYLNMECVGGDGSPIEPADWSDEKFTEYISRQIKLPPQYKLILVYKSYGMARGFDTSAESEKDMRRRTRLIVNAGAVFVYQRVGVVDDWEELKRIEETGIGQSTEHGFGRVRICDEFHVKFDVMGGVKDHDS